MSYDMYTKEVHTTRTPDISRVWVLRDLFDFWALEQSHREVIDRRAKKDNEDPET